jgi:purine-binding chemotaxis protein CheW
MNELTVRKSSDIDKTSEEDEQVFVTLYVANQLFGIPVDQVQDILTPKQIANIPLSQSEVAGAINLRGRIVTVIDMRTSLKLPPLEKEGQKICATVELGHELYSLMVDDIGTVFSLPLSKIEPNVSTLDQKWRDVSSGIVRLEKELMIVLDINTLLKHKEQK